MTETVRASRHTRLRHRFTMMDKAFLATFCSELPTAVKSRLCTERFSWSFLCFWFTRLISAAHSRQRASTHGVKLSFKLICMQTFQPFKCTCSDNYFMTPQRKHDKARQGISTSRGTHGMMCSAQAPWQTINDLTCAAAGLAHL